DRTRPVGRYEGARAGDSPRGRGATRGERVHVLGAEGVIRRLPAVVQKARLAVRAGRDEGDARALRESREPRGIDPLVLELLDDRVSERVTPDPPHESARDPQAREPDGHVGGPTPWLALEDPGAHLEKVPQNFAEADDLHGRPPLAGST